MNTERFSSVTALQFAWNTFRSHLAPLLTLGGASLMLAMISQALGRGGGGEVVLGLIIQGFQAALTLVLLRVALLLHDGAPVDLAEPRPLLLGFWGFLLTLIIFWLVAALGFALLLVPGVLAVIAFGFAPLFSAEGERDVATAFRRSAALARGSWGGLLGMWLMLAGLNLLGVLALGVGVVVTVPLTALCVVYTFRRLQGREPVHSAPMSSLGGRREGMTLK